MALPMIESTVSILGAGIAAHSYVRDKKFHEKSMSLARELHDVEVAIETKHHEEECAISRQQHEVEMDLAKETHIREMNTALESHFQQLNTDLMNATREAERDMYDQRNAEFQTLILCSTVMFTALSTVIIQGQLPTSGISDTFYIFMAVVSGISFALLFLCIVLCTKIVLRSTLFMYRRANNQTKRVYSLIEKTIRLMKCVREFGKSKHLKKIDKEIHKMHDHLVDTFFRNREKDIGRTLSFENISKVPKSLNKRRQAFRQKYAANSDNQNHTATPTDDYPHTSAKNSSTDKLSHALNDLEGNYGDVSNGNSNGEENTTREFEGAFPRTREEVMKSDRDARPGTFEHFWINHCERQGRIATWLFYSGTSFMLISVAVYMYAWFAYTYKSPTGALLAVIFLGISLVIGLSVAYFMDDEPEYKDMKNKNS